MFCVCARVKPFEKQCMERERGKKRRMKNTPGNRVCQGGKVFGQKLFLSQEFFLSQTLFLSQELFLSQSSIGMV